MAPLTEFHATMADVPNDQRQNMAGLVQPDDFNAEVVVRFLRDNGIDACIDESTERFRYTVADRARVGCALRLRLLPCVDKLFDRGGLLVHQG